MDDFFARFLGMQLQLCVSSRTIAPTPVEVIERLTGDQWLWTPKLDGHRCLCLFDGTAARLLSRNGEDISQKFPEIIKTLETLELPVALDCELVHVTTEGKFAPWSLSSRTNASIPSNIPAVLVAFDLLWQSKWDMRKRPLIDRLNALEELKLPGPLVQALPFTDDGHALWAQVQELGLEGLVAKRRNSPYTGGRNSGWVKVKPIARISLIAGETLPSKTRALGSLKVYALNGSELVYQGQVGTGFTEAELQEVTAMVQQYALDPVGRSPVIVDVEHAGRFPDGQLRFASFIRVRTDIDWQSANTDQEGWL